MRKTLHNINISRAFSTGFSGNNGTNRQMGFHKLLHGKEATMWRGNPHNGKQSVLARMNNTENMQKKHKKVSSMESNNKIFFKCPNKTSRQFSKEIRMDRKHTEMCWSSPDIREMQIKTTLGFYFTSLRMEGIKKTNNKYRWRWPEENPLNFW